MSVDILDNRFLNTTAKVFFNEQVIDGNLGKMIGTRSGWRTTGVFHIHRGKAPFGANNPVGSARDPVTGRLQVVLNWDPGDLMRRDRIHGNKLPGWQGRVLRLSRPAARPERPENGKGEDQ